MENLSEHRDRANKMDSNELRTTDPIHVWLREICQRWGTGLVICKSLVTIRYSRCRINEWRGTSVRRCKSRLNRAWLVREPYGVRTEAPLGLSRRPANWSLIACYENFFQQRAVNE